MAKYYSESNLKKSPKFASVATVQNDQYISNIVYRGNYEGNCNFYKSSMYYSIIHVILWELTGSEWYCLFRDIALPSLINNIIITWLFFVEQVRLWLLQKPSKNLTRIKGILFYTLCWAIAYSGPCRPINHAKTLFAPDHCL